MTRALALFLFFASTITLWGQTDRNVEWAIQQGGTLKDFPLAMVVDDQGNSYVTGYFNGTADFDPGAGVLNLTSNGANDIFVTKIDALGNLVWATSYGSITSDRGVSLALDGLGNLYVAGYVKNNTDFNPGGVAGSVNTSNRAKAFLLKLTTSGDFLWVESFGDNSRAEAKAVSVDSQGRPVLGGFFSADEDFDTGPGTTILTNSGVIELFILKLSTNGSLVWAKAFGDSGFDEGEFLAHLTVDANDDVLATGYYFLPSDFDPGIGTSILDNPLDDGLSFVLKLDTNGDYVWAKSFESLEDINEPKHLSTDESNNIYVAGEYRGIADFDPGTGVFNLPLPSSSGLYIVKLDPNGDFLWAEGLTHTADLAARSIAPDGSDGLYIAGFYEETLDFNPDETASFELLSHGEYDAFILKLSQTNGDFEWAKGLGGLGRDEGRAIAIDAEDKILATGGFRVTSDFDQGSAEVNLTSEGNYDSFIVKLNQQGSCEDPWHIAPSDLILDTLYIDALDGSDFFEFTAPEDGFISFSTCEVFSIGNDDFVNVYEENCGNLIASELGNLNCVRNAKWEGEVSAGTTYLFEWGIDYNLPDQGQDTINAVFFYGANHQGYSCATAVPIDCPGEFDAEFKRVPQWFEWTAPSSGTFEVGLPDGHGQTQLSGSYYPLYIEVKNDCGNNHIANNDPDDEFTFTEKAIFPATQGEQYYFLLQNFGYFTENDEPLKLEVAEQGIEPVTAVSISQLEIFGQQVLIASEEDGDFQWVNSDTGNPIPNATFQSYKPIAGGNYHVELTTTCVLESESVNVTLNNGSGTFCEDPYVIDFASESILDTLIVDGTNGADFFQFTVPANGYMTLSSCRADFALSDHNLKVYIDDCALLVAEVGDVCDGHFDYETPVFEGDTYLIEIDIDENAPVENQVDQIFDVVFYYREDLQGTTCQSAQTIECMGDFEVDIRGAEQWFSWISPEAGEYQVSLESGPAFDFGITLEVYTGADCDNLTLVERSIDNPAILILTGADVQHYFRFIDELEPTPAGPYVGKLIGAPGAITSDTETVDLVVCDDYFFDNRLLTEAGTYHATFMNQAGCDSLVTLNLNLAVDDIATSVTACGSYEFDGNTLTASGQYFAIFQNTQLCDSTVNLDLTILPAHDIVETVAGCENYEWQGSTYSESGQYQELFANQAGCDSIHTLNLIIHEPDIVVTEASACDNYLFGGETLTTSGRYEGLFTNLAGCDSLVTLNLDIVESNNVIQEVQTCDSFDFDGQTLTASGQYNSTFLNQAGCDSLVTLDLTILESFDETVEVEACGSYEFDGNLLMATGQYNATFQTTTGCDSLVTLNLSIVEELNETVIIESCDSYEFDGDLLTATGSYNATFQSVNGCDSLVALNLTILEPTTSEETLESCESYVWNGATYTESGTYQELSTNAAGCDSTATLTLTILEPTASEETVESCESYDWNGATYTESGTYQELFTNAAGCDSTATLTLTILEPTTSEETVESCVSYDWNGATYTASGTYQELFTNAAGCDSTATLTLTILEPTASEETVESCESYDWNGATYTESGTYQELFTNAAGCDSTATLTLTILEPTANEETVESCESYDWNGATYTESGTYQELFTNATGCDSTATLTLTILEPTANEETVESCESYDWNGATYTESGTYQEHFSNAAGCDSIATLTLTILEPTANEETVESCESYDWNGATYTESGTYQELFTNAAGCDSTATLTLTIIQGYTETITETVCGFYDFDGQTLTSSGTYNATFEASNGCDSLVALTLTILESPEANIEVSGVVLFAPNTAGAVYQWIDCDTNQPIEGETKRQLTPPRTGNYAVEVTSGDCSSISDCQFFDWVLSTSSSRDLVSIYPTFFNNKITVDLGEREENVTIKILSVDGQLIESKNQQFTSSVELDLEATAGIYFVQVIVDGKLMANERIIKGE